MQARELVELAGLVSAHGPVLVECSRPVSQAALEAYWSASKCRLDRWGRALKEYSSYAADRDSAGANPQLECVIEEVFAGEVLSRIWAAVLTAHDRRHGMEDGEIVSRSILMAHLETRNRALKLLLSSSAMNHQAALRLNRLRRSAERWSDLLLGYLGDSVETGEWAVEPSRADDFAGDLRRRGTPRSEHAVWTLLRLSLRQAFQRHLMHDSPNADLNGRIAASVIGCFPGELFDSLGLMRSLWMTRLADATSDAEGMIEEFFRDDTPPETTDTASATEKHAPITRFDGGHAY